MQNLFLALLFFSLIGCSTSRNENYDSYAENPANGNLDTFFTNSKAEPQLANLNEAPVVQISEREKLLAEGWKEEDVDNGNMSACYNFKSKYNKKINNRLDIRVGDGTDVALKLMNTDTRKCIRYVFINSGTSYTIKNIPEGVYKVKIAYGHNWVSKVENGKCKGRFLDDYEYEEGDDIMDFNIQNTFDGYSIPSYELVLDRVTANPMETFNSSGISEEEFNE